MVVTPQTRFGHGRRPPSSAPMRAMPRTAGWAVLSDSTGVTGHRGQYIYPWATTDQAGGAWGGDSGLHGPPPQGMQAPHATWHEMCIVRACVRCDMGSRVARGDIYT